MITNIQDLTAELTLALDQVKNDRRYCAQAHEIANIGGKLINAQKIQLDYAGMRKEQPDIDFMNV